MISVIVINPLNKTIVEKSIENSLQSIYTLTNATFVEHLHMGLSNLILFNENILDGAGNFQLASGHVINGPAVIVGADDDFTNTTFSVEEVRQGVTFLG